MHAYQRISRYKAALMGIAILIVVYGHYFYYHSGLKSYTELNITLPYTLCSVDMFLFLSGFGIFHSLSKNDNPLQFIQRRLGRLLPSYLPFILVYCLFCLWADLMTKYQALGNLTTFGWWAQIGGQFNWYIPTLIVMYLMSPLFYHIIKAYGRKSLLMLPLFFLIDAGCIGTSLMMGVSRFPVYFLGMFLGAEAHQGNQPSRRHLILSAIGFVVSMVGLYFLVKRLPWTLNAYGFWWHPYIFATPGLVYGLTWFLSKLEKTAAGHQVNRFLSFLGGKSFEIYLCHILVYTMALHFGVSSYPAWAVMAVIGILVGCIYNTVITKISFRRKS